jgi:hypothetical protein
MTMSWTLVAWMRVATVAWIGVASVAKADVETKPMEPYSSFPVDAPLYDAPYNADSPAYPSMQQTLRWSTGAYQMLHWSIGHLVNPYREGWPGFWSRLAFAGFDSLAAYFPLFDSWTHEEFHRAVMGYRGISSHDDVYDLNIGASVIAVSHVKDEDLIELKRDHPADMVRLPAAGVEGQQQLALALEKDAFFDHVANYHQMAILITYLNGYSYVSSGATSDADTMTEEMNEREEAEPVRDFVGHDFTSWVYDLFRPDEPYEARGVHPTGDGIDRYRTNDDLTAAESAYLKYMGNMQLLNLVDPMLWDVRAFRHGDVRWNWSLQHYLTSFGHTTNLNLFVEHGDADVFATVLNYRNQDLSLFGLDLELRRFPLYGVPLLKALSARGHFYRQPARQMFRDQTSRPGGLGALTLYFPVANRVDTYLEVERKTPGWVAGTPYLDAATSGRVGVLVRAF